MSKPVKQIHLAAHFPGVNNTTVWSDPPASGSHIEFSSFVHFAQTPSAASSTSCSWPRGGCGCANRTG